MDGVRFDALARSFAISTSRRQVLRGIAAGLLAALPGTRRSSRAQSTGCDACAPCQSCQDGRCTGTCGPCEWCVGEAEAATCQPRQCLDCERCDPSLDQCVDTCGPCRFCSRSGGDGICIDRCAPCETCDQEANACKDTCSPCGKCQSDGTCSSSCPNPCERCENGECRACREPCEECIGGTCRSNCPECSECGPDGQCKPWCGSDDCTVCEDGICRSYCSACQRCSGGQCVNACEGGQECCGGQCRELSACQRCNPLLGTVETDCGEGQECCSGICIDKCSQCQACFNGSCVDSCGVLGGTGVCCGTDHRARCLHCSACERCDPDSVSCISTCPEGQMCCGGQCIEACGPCQRCNQLTASCDDECEPCEECDERNGVCRSQCRESEICCRGACIECDLVCNSCDPETGACRATCRENETCCPDGQGCTGLQTDGGNCGACGQSCELGEACCAGVCTRYSSDSKNCGGCGLACPEGQRCCQWKCIAERERCPNEVLGIRIRDRTRLTSSRHGLANDITYTAVLIPDPAEPGSFVGTGNWGGKVKTALRNPGQCSSTQMHEVSGALDSATAGLAGNTLVYSLLGGEYATEINAFGLGIAAAIMPSLSMPPGVNSATFHVDNPQYNSDTCWGVTAYQRWAQVEFVWMDPENPPPVPSIPELPESSNEPPIIPAPRLL